VIQNKYMKSSNTSQINRLKPSALRALRLAVQGHYKEIADRSGVTKGYVSHVLKRRRHNNTVIDNAIAVKEEIAQANMKRELRIAQSN
jgi:transcriptional regulator with XRE-family HTH domain